MNKESASRTAYSWGGRFHLANEIVTAEFGVSYKTLCGQLHNPATVKAKLMWAHVPNALACRECIPHEDAPITVEMANDLLMHPEKWGDNLPTETVPTDGAGADPLVESVFKAEVSGQA